MILVMWFGLNCRPYQLARKFYFEEIEMLSTGKDSVALAFAYSNLATN